ncbi:hypothetical protein ASPBRDRAFT_41658 [Aspergillus brasiliensis CBS 101740]|uniref:Uncharacterized protein n=1 Tax=Aspergillus brasiliensis (strain CBS 101740 / IMI 381727 / IBT 21946) TaxID=767769 RepID=A0A1L9UQW0_ASPBC|nr:hypothetical protein ASPBRDRAFT_41658 [Aspergillus brasiliensis CBS 101740]
MGNTPLFWPLSRASLVPLGPQITTTKYYGVSTPPTIILLRIIPHGMESGDTSLEHTVCRSQAMGPARLESSLRGIIPVQHHRPTVDGFRPGA